MYNELTKLINNSNSKYYKYRVAAILECKDGSVYNGVNVETSSPAAGTCAERCALFSALADGKVKSDFKTIYILNDTESNISPCFICRQALVDYCPLDLKIVSYNNLGEQKEYILEELCPGIFGEENFK